MAVTTTPLSNPVAAALVTDTDSDGTSESDVRSGASTVYMIDIDNSLNAAASYSKFYNNVGPTIGTTAPDLILPSPASTRIVYAIPQGFAFATALSFASVTTAGTAGTTNPTSNITIRIVCS